MARQAFICEKCLSPFATKGAAESCESLHCDPQHLKIRSIAWKPTEWAPKEIILDIEHRREPFEGQVSHVRYVKAQE